MKIAVHRIDGSVAGVIVPTESDLSPYRAAVEAAVRIVGRPVDEIIDAARNAQALPSGEGHAVCVSSEHPTIDGAEWVQVRWSPTFTGALDDARGYAADVNDGAVFDPEPLEFCLDERDAAER